MKRKIYVSECLNDITKECNKFGQKTVNSMNLRFSFYNYKNQSQMKIVLHIICVIMVLWVVHSQK